MLVRDRVVLSRTAVVAIALTYLLLGMVVGAFGPLLEHLTHRFAVSLPAAGATISIYFAGGLVGVFAAMRAMEDLSGRALVWNADGIAALGCVAVALAPSWPLFLAGVFVIGIGFGALVLGLNQLVAYSEGGRRAALLSGLNGAYSAGAVVGPIVVATFAAQHFSTLYLGAAGMAVVLLGASSGIVGRLPVAAGRPGRPELLVWIFVVGFVGYVGVENGAGGWMASHLESIGVSSKAAATYTSGFFLALMAGRLLMTLVPGRIPEPAIVLTGSAVAVVTLVAASVGGLAPWAYIATGLAIAPIFPTGIVWLARLRPGDARAGSWLFPATAVGGIVGPGAIGLVVAGFGVGWTPLVLAAIAALMLLAFYGARNQSR
jgi:FHS family glucose/mannose:H+ symporter-like MFS transporter